MALEIDGEDAVLAVCVLGVLVVEVLTNAMRCRMLE
jgi:hypothetical protein